MKRIIGVLAFFSLVATGAFAQTPPDFTKLQSDFTGFSTDVANSLPYATDMGLNWSNAYIGQLLNFGVGLSAGAVFVPAESFVNAASEMGVDLNNVPGLSQLAQSQVGPFVGIPLPSAQAEVRLGGIFLPFDIGLKVGTIPQQMNLSAILPGVDANFEMLGLQLRYDLVKENFLLPDISVGIGVNHFQGYLFYDTQLGNTTLANFTTPDGVSHSVTLTSPTLGFQWNSNSVDFDIQISKTLLFLVTPYIGAGLTIGSSTADGGLATQVELDGSPLTSSDITYYDNLYQQYGQTSPFASVGGQQGFVFGSGPTVSFVPRIFAGTSVNLLILKVDVTGMFNIATQKLGVTLGTRIQL